MPAARAESHQHAMQGGGRVRGAVGQPNGKTMPRWARQMGICWCKTRISGSRTTVRWRMSTTPQLHCHKYSIRAVAVLTAPRQGVAVLRSGQPRPSGSSVAHLELHCLALNRQLHKHVHGRQGCNAGTRTASAPSSPQPLSGAAELDKVGEPHGGQHAHFALVHRRPAQRGVLQPPIWVPGM